MVWCPQPPAPARAGGRHAQGRSVSGRHHRHGADVAGAAAARAARPGHDGGAHAHRQGAARRRDQGEDHRCVYTITY